MTTCTMMQTNIMHHHVHFIVSHGNKVHHGFSLELHRIEVKLIIQLDCIFDARMWEPALQYYMALDHSCNKYCNLIG